MIARDVLKRYEGEALPEFLDIELKDVNQSGNFGNTPLHVACSRGDMEEVDALIAGGANVNATGEHEDTPLFRAAQQGHAVVVRRLLEAGAFCDSANVYGRMPREVAVSLDYPDVVSAIDTWRKTHRCT